MPDVLLDTSFILPTLGVDIEEISSKELEIMKDLSRKTNFCCSYTSFVEIFGLLGRRFRSVDNSAVATGIKSLIESGIYRWVNPSSRALQLAFELRRMGHKDNIDNMLYSIAVDSQMLFLSLDQQLKRFLQKHGYDTDIIVGAKELPKRV
jgi:PIN domain nuclease of toxin-antitoxin system